MINMINERPLNKKVVTAIIFHVVKKKSLVPFFYLLRSLLRHFINNLHNNPKLILIGQKLLQNDGINLAGRRKYY